ncbi:family 1 glycosylhydrolase [Pinibacter aurantiacus]|uniref:dTDP-4-dehydrorhamnose reductase n=1 Tax=Pinibacter aurantiacus TaxID=2851599 RepID=A0A9E2SBF9_9BACT|nr:family 1 glycosylhydrolase [Pinibacter aurantiacus]MBV4359052.1 sugar nucleotide-binding protein [Pinibacter aurantiacus]
MDIRKHYSKPEIWGGLECSINRTSDHFHDQLEDGGYYNRSHNIEAISKLGITTLRFPLLWERHQPQKDDPINWDWATEQLNSIVACNITPIIGLLHHGSGPTFTDLTDDHFPELLSKYAAKVAQQFPWIEYYTPVNEPLTTARFSGLYGLWYPHHKDVHSFLTILLNQLKGVVLSMQAIRKINSNAKLIQTEDLTKVHSTPALQYQSHFENERRWLTYDLLCGRVGENHSMWNYFMDNNIDAESLYFFIRHPCVPHIAGFNYYITSERFLDENIDQYPVHTHGSNGKQSYADVEAVRTTNIAGIKCLLHEAWERYQLPLAVTEVHLGCTREEQIRWLKEIWEACCEATDEDIDIRAITVWALQGSYDWSSLLTRHHKIYEPGAFDVQNSMLRPTAIAKLVTSIIGNMPWEHPLLHQQGWWQKISINESSIENNNDAKIQVPLLIIGKTGTLANAFERICIRRNIYCKSISRDEFDILDEKSIEAIIALYQPWAMINATDLIKVDDAETSVEACFAINMQAPVLLAKVCKKYDIRFLTFSSDLVFGGDKTSPYTETDAVKPLNVYGKSKVAGETQLLLDSDNTLIIRTGAVFGPWDSDHFAGYILDALSKEQTCIAASGIIVSPTYIPDLVNTALDILIDGEKGVWHISNEGKISWADFAREVAERGGHSQEKLIARFPSQMQWKATRPVYSVLKSEKGILLPTFANAMDRFFHEKEF